MNINTEFKPGEVLTPATLSGMFDRLPEGASLILTKRNGRMHLAVVGASKKEKVPLTNSIVRSVSPDRVKSAWMSPLGDPTENDYKIRREHKKEMGKKAAEGERTRDMVYGIILVDMAGLTLEDGTPVENDGHSYLMFELGTLLVYTDYALRIVYWTEGDGKKFYPPATKSKNGEPEKVKI